MRLIVLVYSLLLLSSISMFGQIYPDYFGVGNDVVITTSSSPISNNDSIQTTLDGTGYFMDEIGLYRFMAQAGFGATSEDIDSLQQMSIENWVNCQLSMPYESFYNSGKPYL